MEYLGTVVESYTYAYKRADLDHSGIPSYLVAVYNNSVEEKNKIVIWKEANGSFSQVYSSGFPGYSGHSQKISLVDLNNDRKPEVVVQANEDKFIYSFIFKWNGTSLQQLHPAIPNSTPPSGTSFVKSYDDTLSFEDVTTNSYKDFIDTYLDGIGGDIYSFSQESGRYKYLISGIVYAKLELTNTSEKQFTYDFLANKVIDSPLLLDYPQIYWIFNGNGDGTKRVTGSVYAGTTEIVKSDKLNVNTSFVKVRGPLPPAGTLKLVSSTGNTTGVVRIFVEHVSCSLGYPGTMIDSHVLEKIGEKRYQPILGNEKYDINGNGVIDDQDIAVCTAKCKNADECKTPVPLPTPTITPLPTATSGIRQKLTLTSMPCTTTGMLKWRIRNPNPYSVNTTYNVYNSSVNGSVTATANSDLFFETPKTAGNTVRVYVNNVLEQTKASQGCNL